MIVGRDVIERLAVFSVCSPAASSPMRACGATRCKTSGNWAGSRYRAARGSKAGQDHVVRWPPRRSASRRRIAKPSALASSERKCSSLSRSASSFSLYCVMSRETSTIPNRCPSSRGSSGGECPERISLDGGVRSRPTLNPSAAPRRRGEGLAAQLPDGHKERASLSRSPCSVRQTWLTWSTFPRRRATRRRRASG